MQIKTTLPLVDYASQPLKKTIKNQDGSETETPILMRTVLLEVLNHQTQEPLKLEESIRVYEMSVAIATKEAVELTAEDTAFINTRLPKLYEPMIAGQVAKILKGELPNA